jgi:hypothetical protein
MRGVYILFLSLFVLACSPRFRIQSDTPFPGRFDSYQTFKFYNPANLPASNFSFDEASKTIIFDAVADEMKSRGYASIQNADLMIKIQGGTNSSVEMRSENQFYPYDTYNYYNRYGRYDNFYNQQRNESKKETSIIIDIIDLQQDKIVWQGVGIGTFGKRDEIDELKLREAIASIFTEYPYQANR